MGTLYRCKECGRVFDNDDARIVEEKEYFQDVHGYKYDYYITCPECHGEDLEAGEPCMLCEDDFSTHGLCDACRDELKDSLTITAKALHVSVGKLLDAMNCYGDYYHDGL